MGGRAKESSLNSHNQDNYPGGFANRTRPHFSSQCRRREDRLKWKGGGAVVGCHYLCLLLPCCVCLFCCCLGGFLLWREREGVFFPFSSINRHPTDFFLLLCVTKNVILI